MTENFAPDSEPLELHQRNAKEFIEAVRDRVEWPAHLVHYSEALVDDRNQLAHWGIHPGSTVRRLYFALNEQEDCSEIIIEQITMPEDLAEDSGYSKLQQQLDSYSAEQGYKVLNYDWFSGLGDLLQSLERFIDEAVKQLHEHLSTLGDASN